MWASLLMVHLEIPTVDVEADVLASVDQLGPHLLSLPSCNGHIIKPVKFTNNYDLHVITFSAQTPANKLPLATNPHISRLLANVSFPAN